MGKALPIIKNRGPHQLVGHPGFITVHPSSLLRMPDENAQHKAFAAFVADLKSAKKQAEILRRAA